MRLYRAGTLASPEAALADDPGRAPLWQVGWIKRRDCQQKIGKRWNPGFQLGPLRVRNDHSSRSATLGDRRRLTVLRGFDDSRQRRLGFAKLKFLHGILCDYKNYRSLIPSEVKLADEDNPCSGWVGAALPGAWRGPAFARRLARAKEKIREKAPRHPILDVDLFRLPNAAKIGRRVERFHETIICAAWSFRGATEGGEPGIHSPRPMVMDSGLAAFAAPRNDAAYGSNFEIAQPDQGNDTD